MFNFCDWLSRRFLADSNSPDIERQRLASMQRDSASPSNATCRSIEVGLRLDDGKRTLSAFSGKNVEDAVIRFLSSKENVRDVVKLNVVDYLGNASYGRVIYSYEEDPNNPISPLLGRLIVQELDTGPVGEVFSRALASSKRLVQEETTANPRLQIMIPEWTTTPGHSP